MNDFSETSVSAFDGLHQQQVLALLDVLKESKLSTKEHIERRFLERAPKFGETLNFLKEADVVQDKNGTLSITPAFCWLPEQCDDPDLSKWLISLIIRRDNAYRSEMFEYLGSFQVVNGMAVRRPTDEERSAESAVRNYLMELGVVSFDSTGNQYILTPEHSVLYAQAKGNISVISPSQFQSQRRAREDIGLAAEIAVLSYERRRVGAQLAHFVEHVANRNVAAGYDIQSVTVCDTTQTTPRYIEVKAVPRETFRFYWTANELAVAKLFRSCYYLYLLPVDRGRRFDFERLRMLCNPQSAVFGPNSEWITERNVVRCSLATKDKRFRDT